MLTCPVCSGSSGVIDSRPSSDRVMRRRKCQVCEYRWTTYEIDGDVYKHLMQHSKDLAILQWSQACEAEAEGESDERV